MNIEEFAKFLRVYNAKLNEISKTDVAYKISFYNAVEIFFEKLNKKDKNIIFFYIKNLNKENINKNEIQQDALDYLILLVVKKKRIVDILENLFPEYLEIESIPRSSWRIMRWLQVFISFFIKPKPKLRNLIEARRILNLLRDLQYRLSNSENYLFNINDVDLERKSYKALSIIKEKIFENQVSLIIYNALDEDKVRNDWETSLRKVNVESNFSDKYKENVDIDSFLENLFQRVKLLNFNGLPKEVTILKALFFEKKFSLFEEKMKEIEGIIERNSKGKNAFETLGIYNLIEAVKQLVKLIGVVNYATNGDNATHLPLELRNALNLSFAKINYYYEAYRINLDKQYELCFENSTNFYNILNHLEMILFLNKDLFFHTLNQKFDYTANASLSITLGKLEEQVKELGSCAQNIDPEALKEDMIKISQLICTEVLPLRIALKKIIQGSSIQNESGETSEIYEEINYDEDEDLDSEWDDEGSDISETLSIDAQNSENLGEESPSDSGISDEEIPSLEQHNPSNLPATSNFWKVRGTLAGQFRLGKSELPCLLPIQLGG